MRPSCAHRAAGGLDGKWDLNLEGVERPTARAQATHLLRLAGTGSPVPASATLAPVLSFK